MNIKKIALFKQLFSIKMNNIFIKEKL